MSQGIGTSNRQALDIFLKTGIEGAVFRIQIGQQLLPVIVLILQEGVVGEVRRNLNLNLNINENNYYLHYHLNLIISVFSTLYLIELIHTNA